MHIHSFEIRNIRSIKKLSWEVPPKQSLFGIQSSPSWNVLIGDNGSGKSTVLKSLALAIMGPKNAEALRQDWGEWLDRSENHGSVIVHVRDDLQDQWAGKGRRLENFYPTLGIRLKRQTTKVELSVAQGKTDADRHVWSEKPGWFAASFGPFRRFSGGDKDQEKLFYSHPKLARHISVFGENVALTECLDWLGKLRFEQLEQAQTRGPVRTLLDDIIAFINQPDFLPQGVRFDSVDSKSVRFIDGSGINVPVNALGDGFRSILSLTFELLRQMSIAWPGGELFTTKQDGSIVVKPSGVVMIDEVDAHLHPTWQRKIGFWLTKHFPNVQFIVTTHSPLVCHAAENGSIFRLPTPGQDEEPRMVTGLEKERLIFGSVLDAYGTDLFGEDVSRSKSAQDKQQRLAELNQKALSAELNTKEAKERASLQSLFPSSM